MASFDAFQVRPLGPDDAEAAHALRIEALERHPESFATDVATERARGVGHTRARLRDAERRPNDARTFGAFRGGRLIGTTTVVRDAAPTRRHRACIVAVYVTREARGRGVAGRLLDATLMYAREMSGVEVAYLAVDAGNEPAQRLYRSRGFVAWGTEPDALRTSAGSVTEVHMQRPLFGGGTSEA